MGKPALDPVRSGRGGRDWRVLGVARMKTKGVFMRGRGGQDFAHLALYGNAPNTLMRLPTAHNAFFLTS